VITNGGGDILDVGTMKPPKPPPPAPAPPEEPEVVTPELLPAPPAAAVTLKFQKLMTLVVTCGILMVVVSMVLTSCVEVTPPTTYSRNPVNLNRSDKQWERNSCCGT